jgi:hypothetical protein
MARQSKYGEMTGLRCYKNAQRLQARLTSGSS